MYRTTDPRFGAFLTALEAHGWTVGTDGDTDRPAVYSGTRAKLVHVDGAACWVDARGGKVETRRWTAGKDRTSRLSLDDVERAARRWATTIGAEDVQAHAARVAEEARKAAAGAALADRVASLRTTLECEGYRVSVHATGDRVACLAIWTSGNRARAEVRLYAAHAGRTSVNAEWVSDDLRGVAELLTRLADLFDAGA